LKSLVFFYSIKLTDSILKFIIEFSSYMLFDTNIYFGIYNPLSKVHVITLCNHIKKYFEFNEKERSFNIKTNKLNKFYFRYFDNECCSFLKEHFERNVHDMINHMYELDFFENF